MDECDEKIDGCNPESELCRNTLGGYECDMKCEEGFEYSMAARACVGKYPCLPLTLVRL